MFTKQLLNSISFVLDERSSYGNQGGRGTRIEGPITQNGVWSFISLHPIMRCGQERLDLLVRWCQLIGLVPFRMERDAESGRFLRFSFSWRHPLTYWWLTCKILYVTAYVSYNLNRWTTLEKKVAIYQSTKTEILVLFVGTVFSATTCLFIPETLVFRCSYFSKASRHLHEFDTLLEDHHVPACSTRKFTVIGIVSALILV